MRVGVPLGDGFMQTKEYMAFETDSGRNPIATGVEETGEEEHVGMERFDLTW